MRDKEISKSQQLVESVTLLLQSGHSLINRTYKLFILEGVLARKSLASIAILVILLFGLSLSTWLIGLSLIALLVHIFIPNWILSLLITGMLNLIFIAIIIKAILAYGKNLRFHHTRKHLFSWRQNQHEP